MVLLILQQSLVLQRPVSEHLAKIKQIELIARYVIESWV